MTQVVDCGDITPDTFFNGRLKVHQSRRGYRFSIDAVLLAGSLAPKAGQAVLDLGTGCGIIPLILAFRYPGIFIHGAEVQNDLAQLADFNVTANGMRERIQILHKDVRNLTHEDTRGPVDWIVANPPYRRPSSGRINPTSQKALARHEIALDLEQLITVARRMLKTRGRLVTIYPAERVGELITRMHTADIEPKWLQGVYSHDGDTANLVIMQGVKAGRLGVTLAPPLVVYKTDGTYTPAVEAMFEA